MQKSVKVSVEDQEGVTLIELLVVMAIIGIVVLIGVNMMGGVISKQRLRSAAGEVQTRLRVAQMLSVVKNKPVTVDFAIIAGTALDQADSYLACLDGGTIGDCTDASPTDEFLNLDSGRTSEEAVATKVINPLVDIYDVDFGDGFTTTVTFMPPSGLPPATPPEAMTDAGVLVNGAICFLVLAGDEDDDFEDRYEFRRVTVDPVVGKATMWMAVKPLAAADTNPDCDSQLDEDDPAAEWEKVF
jgi:prepilin-type N-terminal cleavage/methylation domain-containing protein